MKFQQPSLLEKHIETGLGKKDFVSSYLVLHAQREERRKLLEHLILQLRTRLEAEVSFHEGKEWDVVYHALSSPSLFGNYEIVVWEAPKGVSEEDLEKLVKYLLSPSEKILLVIGAESFKPFSRLYEKVSKQLVVLDLSEEKPWDREKRQQQEVLQRVKEEGKTISPKALAGLLSLSEESLSLESELVKVLTYVGDRSTVTEEDIAAVTSGSFIGKWQAAEEIAWEKAKDREISDLSSLLALVGQVRFLLHQGRQIYFYLREGKSSEEIMKLLHIRQAGLQKTVGRIKSYRFEYLNSALSLLYDFELLCKSSSLDAKFLFRYLCIQFTELKKRYAG